MRLIINKALDTINDSVNIKIIEITSADFLNNDLDYFVYKYQIPLIKFTDTEEIFNIKNFKSELSSSLSETEIILDENDLELISSGGGGGNQDLQSVLEVGAVALNIDNFSILTSSYNRITLDNIYGIDIISNNGIPINISGATGSSISLNSTTGVTINGGDGGLHLNGNASGTSVDNGSLNILNGHEIHFFKNTYGQKTITFGEATASPDIFNLPSKGGGYYTLATIEEIYSIGAVLPIYANNAAAITGGLAVNRLYKTATGEIRIVV